MESETNELEQRSCLLTAAVPIGLVSAQGPAGPNGGRSGVGRKRNRDKDAAGVEKDASRPSMRGENGRGTAPARRLVSSRLVVVGLGRDASAGVVPERGWAASARPSPSTATTTSARCSPRGHPRSLESPAPRPAIPTRRSCAGVLRPAPLVSSARPRRAPATPLR